MSKLQLQNMLKIRSSAHLVSILAVVVTVFLTPGIFASALASTEPDILTKQIDFPSPVQWKVRDIEVSLIGMAWGPANSPEMISKSREDVHVQKPEFYTDRPYVLALNFRATLPNVVSTSMSGCSGLGRIKNVEGEIERRWS